MIRQLSVRLFDEEVGILEEDSGDLKFTYADNATTAISQSLPLSGKTFDGKKCRPYFNGLLPENPETKKIIAGIFGTSPNNDFSLLKAIGHDCAGALSLHEIGEPIKKVDFIKLEGEPQTEESLAAHIKSLPEKPFFIEHSNKIRLSLAGAQDKAAVSVIDGQICLPQDYTPTTHIIKPMIKAYKDTILNEYMCLRLAKKIGINTPQVEMRRAKDIPYLLITRYDREVKDNSVKRIHQEDFCQALGIMSSNKYQRDGGPGFKQCFALASVTAFPSQTRDVLMKILMFNFLIGNNDAHGKNFSLLYVGKKPLLAPAYDLLSTEVYPKLDKDMSMKIGSYKKDKLNGYSWAHLCGDIGYSLPAFKKEFGELAQKLPVVIEEEIKELDKSIERDIPNKILEITHANIKRLEKTLLF